MLFNSLTFVIFFACVLLLHNLPFSWRLKKFNLLWASYLFYAAWNPPFNPPAGVTSMAFWVRVVDAHGGSVWKPLLSDHATCPILAGHWYRVRVDWDSGRVGVMPGQFWIEDQGTDGSGAAAAWSGLANCTDDDQSQSPADRKFSPGDQILGGDGIHHVAATNNKTLFFNGLIDWIKVLEVL